MQDDQIYHGDDAFTDPWVLWLGIQMGKSPFWNVQLALGELSTRRSITPIPPVELRPPERVLSYSNNPGCPTLQEFVWLLEDAGPKPVEARSIIGATDVALWNPITGAGNRIKSAEVLKNVPLYRAMASTGAVSIVSDTHKIIRHKADPVGLAVCYYLLGYEVLVVDNLELSSSSLLRKQKAGRGDVVKIETEGDHIYLTGHDNDQGIVAHNYKIDNELNQANTRSIDPDTVF